MRRLEGKTAIVTGGAAGIGLAISRRLFEEGAQIVVVSRNPETAAPALAELTGAVHVAGSVADPATAAAAVAAAGELGGVDVLVNNAGIDLVAKLVETTEEETRTIFETNFFGALWMLQAVAVDLAESGRPGSIINISSRLASIGVPEMVVYGASKGGMLALTTGAAVELAPLGIRVNAVAPGFTATPLFEEYIANHPLGAAQRHEVDAAIPQGRLGTPADVAAAVAFLAADESGHITGASIPIDGGYTAA
jgi:NAD(P)-dependent dehydrogenase (short-subunit alcohol dehydrogenase family)